MAPEKNSKRRRLRGDVLLLLLVGAAVALGLGYYGRGEPGGAEVSHLPYASVAAAATGAGEISRRQVEDMPQSGEPIRFLMLNAENYFVPGEQQRSRYTNKPKPEKSRDAVAEVIASVRPDLVGLVEIGGPLALEDLRRRLRERGVDYAYHRVLTRGGEDRALALLSRLPTVQDCSQANHRLFGQQRRMMLRGILDVVVQAEDGRLFRVMGAHLKSRVGSDPAAAASLREREAHTLALYIRDAVSDLPQLPLLVFGDWNDSPQDASVRLLEHGVSTRSALRRLSPRDSRGEEWTLYYPRGHSYSTFDHIFVNDALRRRMKRTDGSGVVDIPAARAASDHRALWCELR